MQTLRLGAAETLERPGRPGASLWKVASWSVVAALPLLVLVLVSACTPPSARPPPFDPGARTASPASAIERGLEVLQSEYVSPISLDELLAGAVRGIERANLAVPPAEMAALDNVVRPDASLTDPIRRARFTTAIEQITRNPSFAAEARDIVQAALQGASERLDPHSEFVSSSTMRLSLSAAGSVGIDLGRGPVPDTFVVSGVLAASAAARAGIKPGDVVQTLDRRALKNAGVSEAGALLKGPVASVVHVSLKRPGVDQTFAADLIREAHVKSGVRWWRSNDIVYLSLGRTLEAPTPFALREAFAAIAKTGRFAGAVIDLRDNRGGSLDTIVAIAGLLLAPGSDIVRLEARHPADVQDFKANEGGGLLVGKAIVLMVDGRTASGAEILTAALRERAGAVTVGQTTFGAGTVQTVVPLPDFGAIKLTTSLVYAPSGESFQRTGIAPDIPVESREPVVREVDLPNSLPGEISRPLVPQARGLTEQQMRAVEQSVRDEPGTGTEQAADPEVARAIRIARLLATAPSAAPPG